MTDYHDQIEQELERRLADLRERTKLARAQGDWHSYSAFGHRAEGVRDALEGVRRIYHEHLSAQWVAS